MPTNRLDWLNRKYPHAGGAQPFLQICHNPTFNFEDKAVEIRRHYNVSISTAGKWMTELKTLEKTQ